MAANTDSLRARVEAARNHAEANAAAAKGMMLARVKDGGDAFEGARRQLIESDAEAEAYNRVLELMDDDAHALVSMDGQHAARPPGGRALRKPGG